MPPEELSRRTNWPHPCQHQTLAAVARLLNCLFLRGHHKSCQAVLRDQVLGSTSLQEQAGYKPMPATGAHPERRLAVGVNFVRVHGELQQGLNLKSGNAVGILSFSTLSPPRCTISSLYGVRSWTVFQARLVKMTSAGCSCELLHFMRGWVGDEWQHNKLQFHGRTHGESVLQTLAMEKQPLPQARRQILQLIQMLFQGPHVGDQVLLQRDCQLLSRNPSDPQHCRRQTAMRESHK